VRHRKRKGRLSRTSSHRDALIKSLSRELFLNERIVTTLEKAKVARPAAERMITMAKKGGLGNYRRIVSLLGDKTVAKKVVDNIAPRFESRPGGYTRIVKLAGRKLGDSGSKAVLELVEGGEGAGDAEGK
jgi:large subunit ribosomal protein L17